MATTASTTYGTLSYIEEVEPGRIPATGTVRNLRFKKPNFKAATSTKSSEESRISRMATGQVLTDMDVTGGVDFELSAREYDPFLQGLLGSSFRHYGNSGIGATFNVLQLSTSVGYAGVGYNQIKAAAALSGLSDFRFIRPKTWVKLCPTSTATDAVKKYCRDNWFKVKSTTADTLTFDDSTPIVLPAGLVLVGVEMALSTSTLVNATAKSSYLEATPGFTGFTTVQAVVGTDGGKFVLPSSASAAGIARMDLANTGVGVHVLFPSETEAARAIAKKLVLEGLGADYSTYSVYADRAGDRAAQLAASGQGTGVSAKTAVQEFLLQALTAAGSSTASADTTTKANLAQTEGAKFEGLRSQFGVKTYRVESSSRDAGTGVLTLTIHKNSAHKIDANTEILSAVADGALRGLNFRLAYQVQEGAERSDKSFAFEYAMGDIGQFAVYRGNKVDSLDLNIEVGSIVEGSFGFVGMNHDPMSKVSSMPAGDIVSSYDFQPMNSVTDLAFLRVNGKSVLDGVTSFVKSIKLSVKNNLRGRKAVGVFGNTGIGMGALEITGSMEIYLEDETFYNMWLKNQAISLEVALTDSEGYGYLFELPKIHFTDGQLNNSETHADAMLSLPIKAYEDGNGTGIRIVRCVPA